MVNVADVETDPAGGNGRAGSTDRRTRHAVVVGGSIAALLTARTLSAHADRVTVVERDRLPEGPEPRAGVPQSRHTHVLLEGGRRALEELLPGIVAELREHGAPRVGMPRDLAQWQNGRFYRRTPSTVHLLTGTRPVLEWLIRRRVLADSRITLLEGTEVVGLMGDAARVRGVRLRERGARGRLDVRSMTADLVVDASGRATHAPDWLAGIGAEPAHEETLDTGLAYATRLYRAPESIEGTDCPGYYFIPGRGEPHGAVALPIEDGRYLVTLSGLRGSEPPSDEAAFTEFAALLPHPALHDWLLKAQPESAAHTFRATANVRRRYDLPGRRPAGFLAVGDALCAFNPVYGQGMAVAALGALALRDALADPRRTPTTRRVQRAVLGAARQAWDIAAGADRELPGATGNAARTRAMDRPGAWYVARVVDRAPGDPVVGAAFRAACALTAPVSGLFAPRVARAVLFGPPLPAPADPPRRPETV
ncbi:FAD-dependent monooxygenase [Streptomyces scopuliridis]|uniref:FAD-dependent monooxygenase n=1 Tax=Streptomyces scopuliridis TaxID=452529 RepID=A0ACD4ZE39_9ACTN|nr:FAD-dependent monooxygenase [Streptomyces scopuliridis]WSB96435.1 FAD-dependent monooxygenase [Streptomyces scopuliridis]WSC09861.1 FAD-dependent monooxygenase [Streptomyces scopuliridis]